VKVGFIGLGAMGLPMARSLHRAGWLAGAWNRTADKARALAAETGCAAAASPAELARDCDALVLCVSADRDVLDVVDALAPGAHRGLLVLDCSTVSATTARDAAARLATLGVDFLDCPVSGGVEGARDAKLTIMVGGTPETFARAEPVLAKMGRAVTRMGPTGAGQATKATNQILCAGAIQAAAEAMAFAKAEGLPLDRVVEALGQGAGSSWYFVNRAPNMVRGTYPPGFRVKLHDKDLRICREMAEKHGVHLPIVEMTLVHFERLIAAGRGDEDVSSLFRLKDAMFQRGAAGEPSG
jgi:3-hydroxyisobutyrate dehydrogenase